MDGNTIQILIAMIVHMAVGTYLNWLIVSKRLRRYSIRANNSITLPEFFSNRFRESKKTIMLLSAAFILIFFTVYAASCFVARIPVLQHLHRGVFCACKSTLQRN